MIEKKSVSSVTLDIFVGVILTLIVLVTLLPILNVLSISLSDSQAVYSNSVTFYPIGLNFEAYASIFGGQSIPRGFKNSIIIAGSGCILSVLLNCIIAYPMSKPGLPLKKLYWTLMIIPMYISGGMIPSFVLISNLKMYDTIWALILPGAVATSTMIIIRTFFQGLPHELEEAALIDGASYWRVFFQIVLPLSKPILATMGLFSFISHWNNYFGPLIYIQTQSKQPLQVILQQIITAESLSAELMKQGVSGADVVNIGGESKDAIDSIVWVDRIKYATLFSSMLPILVIFPFLQKYFAKGVIIGSLKG